ncbi:hypothetical protein IGI04_008099, partial [Brassica rapa subsp. trilocularis]
NSVILTDILTENEILGIFRRISEEIPRKPKIWGSSEFPRNIPRKSYFLGIFRGNTEEIIFLRNIPMKYRGNHIFSEFLLIYIVPRNFLGIFRGNSEEHMFGVFPLPFIKVYKCFSYVVGISFIQSEKCYISVSLKQIFDFIIMLFKPQNVVFGLKTLLPWKSLGIFRGNSEEKQVFLGISSEYSEAFPTIKGFAFRVSVSSEKPRNIPRLFRGSRVFKPKTKFCGLNNTYITPIKCLRLIMKSKFV